MLEIRRTTEITVEPEGIWALLDADRLDPSEMF